MKIALAVALAMVLAACLSGCSLPPASGTGCTIETVGQSALRPRGLHYQMPVQINDATVPFVVDTGSERTLLDAGMVGPLGLRFDGRRTSSIQGSDGTTGKTFPDAKVPRLSYAGIERYAMNVALTEYVVDGVRVPMGILGADLLATYDMEIDFPARQVRFYRVTGCTGRYAPWEGKYDAVGVEFTRRRVAVVPVRFDGHELRLALDTGATHTKISMEAAIRLGLDPARLRSTAPSTSFAVGGGPVINYLHRFEHVGLGERSFRNVPIGIAETQYHKYDGLLGLDFLRAHRLWLSHATGQLFLQRAAAPSSLRHQVDERLARFPAVGAEVAPVGGQDAAVVQVLGQQQQ